MVVSGHPESWWTPAANRWRKIALSALTIASLKAWLVPRWKRRSRRVPCINSISQRGVAGGKVTQCHCTAARRAAQPQPSGPPRFSMIPPKTWVWALSGFCSPRMQNQLLWSFFIFASRDSACVLEGKWTRGDSRWHCCCYQWFGLRLKYSYFLP